jgi:ATP-binding cassette subfamily B protein
MPFLIVGAKVLTRRLHRLFTTVQEEFAQLTEFTRNTLATIPLVKAYNQEQHHSRQFVRLGRSYVRHNFRLSFINGALFPLSGLVANTSMLLILLVGGKLVINQQISIGDFVAFIAYLYMLTWPMMALGWVVNLFQRGRSSLKRINNVLQAAPLLALSQNGRIPPEVTEIQLKDLSFTYPNGNRPVLKKLNLTITPGIWGITGRTGCGKTTLCHLLAYLYPLEENMIYWNGQDINKFVSAAVRRQISYAEQDGILFSDTIRANIAIGKPEAGDREIESVAELADIHNEIKAMPQGYDTMIGEKGVLLSGGQRQRILLARSLLPGRPLLLIDDALSAVDSATEQRIIANLSSYPLFRICIIVSHRVIPLGLADKIIIIDDGMIAAVGSHAELKKNNEFYATICRQQEES